MNAISQFAPLLDSLGWAILHSLWQISLAAIMLALFFRLSPTTRSEYRYWISYGVLALCGAAFLLTFGYYWEASSMADVPIPLPGTETTGTPLLGGLLLESPTPTGSGVLNWQALVSSWTPYIAFVWGIGVLFYSLKYSWAFYRLRRFRRQGLSPVPATWVDFFNASIHQAGIRRTCQLFYSSAVSTPLTIGCTKPIVLVPLGFFLQLSPSQAEAVLWHEIAHIKRYDYYWNLLQLAIKSLLFFHPGIHYISACIEREREYVCDDFAVRHIGGSGPLIKALGLLRIQSFHHQNTLAMSVIQKKHPFVQRLQRLFNSSSPRESGHGGRVLMLLLFILAASMLWAYQVDRPLHPLEAEVLLSTNEHIDGLADGKFATLRDTVPHEHEEPVPAPAPQVHPPAQRIHPVHAPHVKPPLHDSHPTPAPHPANRAPETPTVAPAQGLNGVVAPAPRAVGTARGVPAPAVAPAQGLNGVVAPTPRGSGTARLAPTPAIGSNVAPRIASAASPTARGYAAALPAQAESLFGIAESLSLKGEADTLPPASLENIMYLLEDGQIQAKGLFEEGQEWKLSWSDEKDQWLFEDLETGNLFEAGTMTLDFSESPALAGSAIQGSNGGRVLKIDQLKRALLRALLNDQLIENRTVKVILNYQEDGITIDGRALPSSLHEKYTRILTNHQVTPGPNRTVRISPKYIMVGDYTPEEGFSGHMSGTVDIENDLK